MSDVPKLAYNVQELSKATGMSTDQIYALIKTGQLRARKVGARWIIPTTAINEFLEERGVASLKDA